MSTETAHKHASGQVQLDNVYPTAGGGKVSSRLNPLEVDGEQSGNKDYHPGLIACIGRMGGNRFIWNVMELSTIAMGLIAIGTSAHALSKTFYAKSELGDLLDNWKAAPYTNAVLVASGSSCPTGYESKGPWTLTWPGSSDSCGCPSNAIDKYSNSQISSSTACNSNQTDAGCKAGASADSVTLNAWKGMTYCFQTDKSQASATFPGEWGKGNVRPTPGCPSGYHACGNGTYDNDMATCAPDAETNFPWPHALSTRGCPLSLLSTTPVEPSAIVTRYTPQQTIGAFVGTSVSGVKYYQQSFYAAAGADVVAQLPIVELTPAFYPPCFSSDNFVGAYNGTSDVIKGQVYPNDCEKGADPRWNVWDTIDESDLLYENFFLTAECKQAMIDANLTKAQLVSSQFSPDYFTSSIKCGTSVPGTTIPAQFACSPSGDSTKVCDSNDVVCQNTFYQSECGAYLYYAKKAAADAKKVKLYSRSEVFWASTCPYTKQDVFNSEVLLRYAFRAQGVLAGFVLFGEVVLILLAVRFFFEEFGVCNKKGQFISCASADEDKQKPTFEEVKDSAFHYSVNKWQIFFRFILLCPCLVATAIMRKLTIFYTTVDKSNDCTDNATRSSFDTLALTFPRALSSDGVVLAMVLIQFVYPTVVYVYHIWYPTATHTPVQSSEPKQEEA